MATDLGAEPSLSDDVEPSTEDRLAQILDRYLEAVDRGEAPSHDALLAEHPDLASSLRGHLKNLDRLRDMALDAPRVPEATAHVLGDFQLLREIGRGGMGVVYEARQISLGRHVALKVMPFAAVLDAKRVSRFTHEARAAAQLHHPHIVPVFAVGCERGIHHYAMHYVDGPSLEQVLADLAGGVETLDASTSGASQESRHESTAVRADDSRERSSAADALLAAGGRGDARSESRFRQMARLAFHAAEALQHAHECGVIHRDIKPSNLLLDRRGHLWVTDFGLALCQSEANLTATGDVLGTLRYMSPEQAAGQPVDERTDVYSLGITLYEMLAGRPAFTARDRTELARLIESHEPPRLRKLQPHLPADLETIVLKATAKSRDERYPSAAAFARDLNAWLEQRPILARRPSLSDYALKWAARHRSWLIAGGLVGVAAIVGLSVATFRISRAESATRNALEKVEDHFRRSEAARVVAEDRYRLAREVVDRFGVVHADELARTPGNEVVRRTLLEESLRYYERLASTPTTDPFLEVDVAIAWFKLGEVADQLSFPDKSRSAYVQAQERLAGLAERKPKRRDVRRYLALSQNNLGLLHARDGSHEDAESLYEAAHLQQQNLLAEEPSDTSIGADLAATLNNRALLRRQTGHPDQAAALWREAVRLDERLLERLPGETRVVRELAVALHNLAELSAEDDLPAAIQLCRRALELQTKLTPGDANERGVVAAGWSNLGVLLRRADRRDEARDAYQQAIAELRRLRRAAPDVAQHGVDLAVALNNLGWLDGEDAKFEAAEQELHEAREILGELRAQRHHEPVFRSGLAGVLNNLGLLFEKQERWDDAITMFRQAADEQRQACAAAPESVAYRELLGQHEQNLARVLRIAESAETVEVAPSFEVSRQTSPFDPH